MKVRDIMSSKVVSISHDDTLQTVSEIMELGSVRHLPVVRGGELMGVVSQRDLLKASLSSVMGIAADEQSVFLAGVSIADVMSSPAVSVDIDASVQEAAGLMAERKIGCLTVLDGEKFAGLVTETDVLRCFADSVAGTGP
jgi:CBS domain-containing protein